MYTYSYIRITILHIYKDFPKDFLWKIFDIYIYIYSHLYINMYEQYRPDKVRYINVIEEW